MRFILLSLLAALIAVQAPRSPSAQPQVPLTYVEQDPDQLVAAAFSTPYGRLMIAEFAAMLAESADASCLKANRIEKSELEQRVRAITLRHGAQLVRKYAATVDRTAFKTNFASKMGARAEAEMASLRKIKDVLTFVELHTTIRHAAVVNSVTEVLDRNILILKFKVSRPWHPLETGEDRLVDADPTYAALEKGAALIKSSKSGPLMRYFVLVTAAQDALNQSIDTKAWLAIRSVELTPGLESDLAGVCIRRSK